MKQAIHVVPTDTLHDTSENMKYIIITSYAVIFLIISFLLNSPKEIMEGLKQIVQSPSILLTDYFHIGNIGATFFNSSILMLSGIALAFINKAHMNGTLIAALFTVGGFAFFGKNIYNSYAIMAGVYIYSRIVKEKYSKFILIAFFGTALGPLVSQLTFGAEKTGILHILTGNLAGLIVGIVLPPLAGHFVKFHQGFNLYNVGFTCGMIGTFAMSFIHAFGEKHPLVSFLSSGNNKGMGIIFLLIFTSMILIGFLLNNKSFRNFIRLFRHSGRLVEDFVIMDGFPIAMLNMGTLGLLLTLFILLVGGQLNGPVIGGILTVVGFGAFGKHPKNIAPVVVGVLIGALFQGLEVNTTSVLVTTLFSTTLAPIAGRFGWLAGITAGFLHLIFVVNLGPLHGGMNLYNNGFSGGFVAATLVPLIEAFKKEK
ncbi:MAG TPA: DUF1576 domain-containing protein [Clostridiales bacterium]|nr:DUF1576 domain-containing protein [Clostridiales bacterium]